MFPGSITDPITISRGSSPVSNKEDLSMAFFNSAVGVLQTLGAKSQGMKQLMAGGGVALIGITLVPLLSGLFG